MTNGMAIVRELMELPADIRPRQFNNLVAACRFLPIYRLAKRFIKPGLKALDWGYGNGHFSYFLLRQGLHVQGFSTEPGNIQLAGYLDQQFSGRYRMIADTADSPTHLPFPDRHFDLVFSIGELERNPGTSGLDEQALLEIVRVLRPNGHVICGMLPKRYSWLNILAGHDVPDKLIQLYRYTRNDIGRLTRDAGLKLVRTETHGFLPRESWNRLSAPPLGGDVLANFSYNAIDRLLSLCAAPLALNFMFAARRPSYGHPAPGP